MGGPTPPIRGDAARPGCLGSPVNRLLQWPSRPIPPVQEPILMGDPMPPDPRGRHLSRVIARRKDGACTPRIPDQTATRPRQACDASGRTVPASAGPRPGVVFPACGRMPAPASRQSNQQNVFRAGRNSPPAVGAVPRHPAGARREPASAPASTVHCRPSRPGGQQIRSNAGADGCDVALATS